MDKLNEYFKKYTSNVTFIEVKENSFLDINEYRIEGGLPLPIITDSLISEVKNGRLEDEINLANVVEGIIYLLGVDNEFLHIEEYKKILSAFDEKILDYMLYKGMKAFEDKLYDDSAIYYRAILVVDPEKVNVIFNYALVLEEIAKDYLALEKSKEGADFLIASTNQLETILDIQEDFSLAYYKLGFHYKYLEQYLKAKLIWSKFLLLDKDDTRLQEIREEIELIDEDVSFETGLTYLAYNDFGKAADSFLKLMPKYENHWNANYLIGLSFKGLEEYGSAIEYLTIAINLNKEEADVYNELGIIFFDKGDIVKAIGIFSEGIDNCTEDYKLFFNRGLGYVQLGQYEIALRDIDKAYLLNPSDQNIALQKEKIEELLESI